jgi:apolipoprotein N-acyltransferase
MTARAPSRPRAGALGLAALTGAAVGAGQAPLSWWWLSLPALCWLMWQISAEAGVRGALWRGWVAGAGYFTATMFWIVEPFLIDVPRHGWMAPFALVFMALGMALFWAGAAGLAVVLGGASRRRRILGLAVAFALAALLRGYLFTGFPWALIGHVWIGTPVMQLAAFIGPVGLTFFTTLLAALPLLIRQGPVRIGGVLVSLILLGFAMWVGLWRLDHPAPDRATPIHVRLLQPNASQRLKWDADLASMFFRRQLEMTAAPGAPPPDLVIWPETAVPWLLDRAAPALEMMAEAAGGAVVATGIQRSEGPRYYNSLVVLDGGGGVDALYDKHHLVPFGEYVPFGDALARIGIGAFAAQRGAGYSAGPGPQVLDLGPLGRALPLICYEAVFPRDLRAPGPRADWILQVTNDGWFGNVAGPWQHLAQARLRAVEQGLPLLRSANTGITAVIDAQGRILQSLALNTAGSIDAPVPGALPPPLYARIGDRPILALLLLLALALVPLRLRDSD